MRTGFTAADGRNVSFVWICSIPDVKQHINIAAMRLIDSVGISSQAWDSMTQWGKTHIHVSLQVRVKKKKCLIGKSLQLWGEAALSHERMKIFNHFLTVRNAYLLLHDLNSFTLSKYLSYSWYWVIGAPSHCLPNIKLATCSEGGVASVSVGGNEANDWLSLSGHWRRRGSNVSQYHRRRRGLQCLLWWMR